MRTRPVVVAPLNTPCGHYSGCQGPDRDNAIHVMVESFPAGRAGTALCGYHSPFDVTPEDRGIQTEKLRWEVTLTPNDRKNQRVIQSFTWAPTREAACERMAEEFAAHPIVWGDWTFAVASNPTELLH